MTRRLIARLSLVLALLATVLPTVLLEAPHVAVAAASMYVSASSPVRVGDTVVITIGTNTGGDSANSWDGSFTYPTALFDPVRGSTTGSVCNIFITQPEPNNGSAQISCGKSGGFTGSGTLATIYLSAKSDGTATFGLSGCTVLANDGLGTDITGGCSGKSIVVNPQTSTGTPPPTSPTPTPTKPNGTNTPKPPTTPKPTGTPPSAGPTKTPLPSGTPVPVDQANKPSPTPTPSGGAAVTLPSDSPGSGSSSSSSPGTSTGGSSGASGSSGAGASASPNTSTEKRSIGTALKDVFASFGSLKGGADTTGSIALLLAMIPGLAILCAILFLIYRLYGLEQRRRRTLDRLFEMELSELAALEGKMDLLAEKGTKGREEYREEFEKTKEKILRQLKPSYGKPVDPEPAPKKE
jgi:uncharacterized membrane protein YgcG